MTSTLFSLAGKTAWVTGGHRGLGWAIAQGLADAGARVVVGGRNGEAVAAAVHALELAAEPGAESGRASSGPRSAPVARGAVFDVTDAEAVERATAELTQSGWAPDILVNNAGIHRRSRLLEMPLEDFRAVLETNLTAPFSLTQRVVPGMIARGGGKVIHVASLMSELARPTTGNYAAAKGGLKMLTRAMAAEWSGSNVQVNAIAPGYFETELNRPLTEDPKFDAWVRGRTPAGRWGKPDELRGVAVFLASAASQYVSGQLIVVDGGLSAVV